MARPDLTPIGLSSRSANFRDVLDEIWNTDAVNRAGIARRTGLSRTTISDMVNELIELGVVEETGAGASRGGRRPILLRPVADARAVIGVEAGASHVDVVVMNLAGEIVASAGAPHGVPHDVYGTLELIDRLLEECMAASCLAPERLLGMGLAVSAPLDGDELRHVSSMMMPAWDGIDVIDLLESRFGLRVRMDNDANLGAVAERWWGSGQGCDDFTYIKLGVGVGAGHIVGGSLFRGSGGTAGEIGHIDVGGSQRCRCGRVGCVEIEVGSAAIVARYLDQIDSTSGVTIDDVARASRDGDEIAMRIVVEAGDTLGAAIAPILNVLNPARIILGGPVTNTGTLFLDAVSESVRQRAFPKTVDEVSIVVSTLQHLTVAIGAATAALEVTFDGGSHAWNLRPVPDVVGVM